LPKNDVPAYSLRETWAGRERGKELGWGSMAPEVGFTVLHHLLKNAL